MKIEHLIMVIVGGVILADMVAHVAGTKALFHGFNILWAIGTNPTDTSLISTSTSNTKPATTGGGTKLKA
jgi:hypothetical protein